ncbi:MAG: LytTR family transcriptional regulator DNA-binding domain-containing protein [Hydrogenophaga sp.]|uniref:PAS domain-containing transcriptional regulator n=1 Tax=Hydrogenophaga sp. TaxID=1904254 RepID=UPI002735D736|nr:PAS domain-containing transcriptional regulator [Hydrogenophaga sp.]MDP3344231.1 LytTR family transcriptional regulator DNA-binding domain-containing protein [Hydrogenophaga sp.]MDP3807423.1 LytTR family transcriptional regulator DNA-binding domain-containing protein [Hydrogenophaga sp.]MDP3922636.1 LytTR family transcriptional regulator DNA-binding domain-containing protein [Hydrogenophaga sp.]
MDVQAAINSPLYLFEKFEVGVIHLDAQRTVLAMNDFARKVLPVGEKQPFDKLVSSFHPERSKPKVNFLLDQASSGCPMVSAVPMTMIINIPEQVLLIKVTRLGDAEGKTTGFILVFYDVTQVVSQEAPAAEQPAPNLRLNRIPMVANHKVAFVDAKDVLCLESQAHYTRVLAHDGFHFCNLSIGDLQARLDPAQFMRVHRCFIVNLHAVAELGREGSKTHVVLKGKHREPIPVSRAEAGKLREALGLLARH